MSVAKPEGSSAYNSGVPGPEIQERWADMDSGFSAPRRPAVAALLLTTACHEKEEESAATPVVVAVKTAKAEWALCN